MPGAPDILSRASSAPVGNRVAAPLVLDARRPADVVRAATILRTGGVVVIPTDTLYGIAASIYSEEALQRVYTIKQRPNDMRLPVLLATAADLGLLVDDVPRTAWKLIDRFWPGSVTIVLPASSRAPKIVLRGSKTIAVRVPALRPCLELLQTLGEPVVGTSANLTGRPAIRSAEEALTELPGVDAVLEDRDIDPVGKPSTIVKVLEDQLQILRVGAVSVEDIRTAAGAAVMVVDHAP